MAEPECPGVIVVTWEQPPMTDDPEFRTSEIVYNFAKTTSSPYENKHNHPRLPQS